MTSNPGVAPPDVSTSVGKMRVALGDSAWVPLVPDVAGMGDYQIFSDAELEVFLELSGDNVPRAIAMAYRQIGASWASTGATIRTDDLSYSAKDSVGNWMNLAAHWDKVAADQEARAANDYFDLVTPGGDRSAHERPPEASPEIFYQVSQPW